MKPLASAKLDIIRQIDITNKAAEIALPRLLDSFWVWYIGNCMFLFLFKLNWAFFVLIQ